MLQFLIKGAAVSRHPELTSQSSTGDVLSHLPAACASIPGIFLEFVAKSPVLLGQASLKVAVVKPALSSVSLSLPDRGKLIFSNTPSRICSVLLLIYSLGTTSSAQTRGVNQILCPGHQSSERFQDCRIFWILGFLFQSFLQC